MDLMLYRPNGRGMQIESEEEEKVGGIRGWIKGMASVAALSLVGAACGSGASSASSAPAKSEKPTGPIVVGELLPMSGAEGFVGQWFDHGVKAGIEAVNAAGGVMGQKLTPVLEDTAGDPVDAVTAWQTLRLHNPKFIMGPSSLEIMGVINDFQSAKIVDLMEGGTTQLDHMRYSYVYRLFPSDSALLAAEAYYALHNGCKRASLMYTSDANAQAEVPPVVSAFTHNGGTLLQNVQLVAGQSSYLTEVSKAFQGNPQCVFFHADPQTAATLFANVRQLGHMNVKFITGDTGASIQLAQAMGLADASKYMTGMAAPAAYAQSYNAFLTAYQAVWHTNKPLPASPAMYDGVVIAALAMTMAHSTNPQVWRADITKVSNPPGVKVYTYQQGLAALAKGEKINYQGASGPEDFNKYHNVFSAFQVVQFNSTGQLRPIYSVTAPQVASMYSKS